ncbi:hypothetical protein [Parvicella tangerina]|jgi:hypothetical protein|uniref:Uncharacterized protein n=1 Tax=Parvicella tangerina TaxID=2829795 RepID=A0A916JN67_9FLAO|nr:hypothetical protein [Parvicella tangerina]CAG5082768.1 hypothetical protein CRYO30217_02004 [Parvicella tangerina]
MSYKHNIIKERFDLKITSPNQVFKGEFELDKNANFLIGIGLTSDRDDLLFYRGTQKIQVNDQELFPEEFESRLLMSGINVSPNDRMIKVGKIETGNGRVEIWFKDQDHPLAKFTPYRVTIYTFSKVDCDND